MNCRHARFTWNTNSPHLIETKLHLGGSQRASVVFLEVLRVPEGIEMSSQGFPEGFRRLRGSARGGRRERFLGPRDLSESSGSPWGGPRGVPGPCWGVLADHRRHLAPMFLPPTTLRCIPRKLDIYIYILCDWSPEINIRELTSNPEAMS